MNILKFLITILLLFAESSVGFGQIRVIGYRILDQYLYGGQLKIDPNSIQTTFEYEVDFMATMNTSTGYAKPGSVKISIGLNGNNLENSAVYVSQAKTIQSSDFPQHIFHIVKRFSSTIQNNHLLTGKKVDVWQYIQETQTFLPLNTNAYNYINYTPPPPTPTIPDFTISGPNIICSEGTYTVSNIPEDTHVTWQSTGSIIITGANDGPTVTVNKTSDGPGTITAKMIRGTAEKSMTKAIMAGIIPFEIVPNTTSPLIGNGTYTFSSTYNFSLAGSSTYTWSVIGGTIISGQGTEYIEVKADPNNKKTTNVLSVTVTIQYPCGTVSKTFIGHVQPGSNPSIE